MQVSNQAGVPAYLAMSKRKDRFPTLESASLTRSRQFIPPHFAEIMNPTDPYSPYHYQRSKASSPDAVSFCVYQRGGLRRAGLQTAESAPTEAFARLYAMAPEILAAFESLVSEAYRWFDTNWDVEATRELLEEIVEDETDEWEDAYPSITANAWGLLYFQSLLDELGHCSRDYSVPALQMNLPFEETSTRVRATSLAS